MKLGNKIKELVRKKNIKEVVNLLKMECKEEYSSYIPDDAIHIASQASAEMMIEILEYYKTKNPEICDSLNSVSFEIQMSSFSYLFHF